MGKKVWIFRGGLVGLLLVFFLALTTVALAAPKIVAIIPVQISPNGIWTNPITNRTYVSNSNSNTVSVIDGLTNTVLANVPVGNTPIGVNVNSTTNRIYTANEFSNDVSVIDGTTNTVITNVLVGAFPAGVGVNSTTNRIYTANNGAGSVSVIDGTNNTVLTTLPIGGAPYSINVNSVTNRVYVGNRGNNTLAVIDGLTNSTLVTVPVGTAPNTIAVNTATNRIYVPNTGSNNVTVIDGATNNVLTTIPVGSSPSGASVNTATNRIYISNGTDGTISVIDGTTNTVLNTFAGANPADISVNPNLNRIYVTNYNSQTVTVLADPVPPTISKAFATTSVPLNSVTSLTFTLTNPNRLDKLTEVTFTDNFPAGLQVAPAPNLNNGCGGTLTASGSQIKLDKGVLEANQTCTIKVDVKATTAGDKNNTTEPISAAESGVGKASNTATLSVRAGGPQAQLRFAHLAPVTANVDIYVNRKLLLSNVAYGTVSPYFPYRPGTYAIDIIKTGQSLSSEPLSSESIDLENREAYTYSLLNFNDDTSVYSYFYIDDLKAPAAGKAKLKILHASPDAEAVDVVVKGGATLASEINNGENTEYLQLNPGTYVLEVRQIETGKVLYTTPPLNLKAGVIYTAIAEGLVNGKPTFKVDLVTDVGA